MFTPDTNPGDLIDKLTADLEDHDMKWEIDRKTTEPFDVVAAVTNLVSKIHDWNEEQGEWSTKYHWKCFSAEDLVEPRNKGYLWPYNFQIFVTDESSIVRV